MEFFQKIKSTSYTSYPSITTINLQNINQLIKKKSLFEPIFQEDPGHNVSVLLLLRLCQGITSWLVQEAEKKKWSRRRKKTPLCPMSPTPQDVPPSPTSYMPPPLSQSSALGSKSLPNSPSGTKYSTSSLVRINLHVGFHSPCGELFQLLNIQLLQHNLEYLNSTTELY